MTTLQDFGGQLLIGTLITIELAMMSIVLGSIFGVVGCWLQLRRNRALRGLGYLYAAVIRGIPDLLVVFAIYFGGALALASVADAYVEVNAFAAGVFALSLSFGAYAAEIARGALMAVPQSQREAATTLGLSKLQTLGTVIVPQAARTALAPFGNQAIILIKQTSIVSIVGCDELMRKAAEASGATRQPFTMYLAAACIYLVLTGITALLLEHAERRSNKCLGA